MRRAGTRCVQDQKYVNVFNSFGIRIQLDCICIKIGRTVNGLDTLRRFKKNIIRIIVPRGGLRKRRHPLHLLLSLLPSIPVVPLHGYPMVLCPTSRMKTHPTLLQKT
jgi:hypothetical protein